MYLHNCYSITPTLWNYFRGWVTIQNNFFKIICDFWENNVIPILVFFLLNLLILLMSYPHQKVTQDVSEPFVDTLPETNSQRLWTSIVGRWKVREGTKLEVYNIAPEINGRNHQKKKGSSSNHDFSGVDSLLNIRESIIITEKPGCFRAEVHLVFLLHHSW